MSFARPDRLIESTAFRLSATYAGLLFMAFLLAGIVAWFASRNASSDVLISQVETEVAYIEEVWARGGLDAATEAVSARLMHPTTFTYRIETADGRFIAGEDILPSLETGWHVVDPPDRTNSVIGDYLVLTSLLSGGERLSIGDDLERSESIRNAVLRALMGAGLISVLIALGLGILATRGTLSRMGALSTAVRQVAAGDLSVRAPARRGKKDDDIDILTTAFNDMLGRLETLVGSLKRVSANVAHDLRTPLAHLSQRIEAAQNTDHLSEVRAQLGGVQEDIERLQRTFEAMLRLSEIESGVLQTRFAAIDVSKIVESVLDAYRPDIESSGRTMNADICDQILLDGDAGLVAQLVANIIENALHHTPAGSNIDVTLKSDLGRAVLSISDNGLGIPSADRERLLGPFERGDSSRTVPGTGLGLSIAAAVARLHRGNLSLVEASPGLLVEVTLPLRA